MFSGQSARLESKPVLAAPVAGKMAALPPGDLMPLGPGGTPMAELSGLTATRLYFEVLDQHTVLEEIGDADARGDL